MADHVNRLLSKDRTKLILMFAKMGAEVEDKTFPELHKIAEELLAPKLVSEYSTKEVLKDMGLRCKQPGAGRLPCRKELTRDTVRAICEYLCKCEDIIQIPIPANSLIKTFTQRKS